MRIVPRADKLGQTGDWACQFESVVLDGGDGELDSREQEEEEEDRSNRLVFRFLSKLDGEAVNLER